MRLGGDRQACGIPPCSAVFRRCAPRASHFHQPGYPVDGTTRDAERPLLSSTSEGRRTLSVPPVVPPAQDGTTHRTNISRRAREQEGAANGGVVEEQTS